MLNLWMAVALAGPIEPPAPAHSAGSYHPMQSFAPLVDAVRPGVVTIEVEERGLEQLMPPALRDLHGHRPSPTGQGSGFLVGGGGRVLTNHHVISHAAEVTVVLHDGRRLLATVVGSDASLDLAILKLEDAEDLPVLVLGDSDTVRVGDWVLALGNTLGLGTTATVGIVGAKGRVLGHDAFGQEDYIQTDAAINHGNSGGPLFDLSGHVVGMNTAVIAGANTVGFAIPSNLIQAAIPDLETHGRITRGYLGVRPRTLDEAQRATLSAVVAQGAVVSSVFDDTPAARSGLAAGDVVYEVDGIPIASETELIEQIANKRPGDRVELRVERAGKRKTFKVVLTERPLPGDPGVDDSNPVSLTAIGLDVLPMSRALATALNVAQGVIVADVGVGSVVHGVLEPGDVILEINRQPVRSARDVSMALGQNEDEAAVRVLRDGEERFVTIALP